ncbi:MAG: hypothetical protein ACTSWQ_08485 [Candidatus Thorarchaeota archaeon]
MKTLIEKLVEAEFRDQFRSATPDELRGRIRREVDNLRKKYETGKIRFLPKSGERNQPARIYDITNGLKISLPTMAGIEERDIWADIFGEGDDWKKYMLDTKGKGGRDSAFRVLVSTVGMGNQFTPGMLRKLWPHGKHDYGTLENDWGDAYLELSDYGDSGGTKTAKTWKISLDDLVEEGLVKKVGGVTYEVVQRSGYEEMLKWFEENRAHWGAYDEAVKAQAGVKARKAGGGRWKMSADILRDVWGNKWFGKFELGRDTPDEKLKKLKDLVPRGWNGRTLLNHLVDKGFLVNTFNGWGEGFKVAKTE